MPVNRAGSLTGRRLLAAVVVAFACVLAGPGLAHAESFTVNTVADEVDLAPGDEFCVTAASKCSLRAALEESNFTGEAFDVIAFEEGVFEGDGDSVIELTSALPAIASPLSLSGRECETEAGVRGPCVEIDGIGGAPVLSIEETREVEIEALALTGGEAGIAAAAALQLRIRSSWIGVGLDGAAAGNETGIEVGPGSDKARIGGEGTEARNFIVNSAETGLDILGASDTRVLGNQFGVAPTGAPAPNGTALRINSFKAEGSDEEWIAIDNVVGTRVSPTAAASLECDGGCNLIAASSASGVDLTSEGESRLPAIGTTIAGNQIGLGATGGDLPNGGAGIHVGQASRTAIGGPRPGDENRIAGGSAAVIAGPGAPNLVVRGNLIGSRATAAGTAAPPQDGLLIDSEGLSFPAEEAQILDNEVGLGGGTGISQQGLGGEISGNLVEGAATGIEVREGGSENLIEANVVDATGVGILVNGPFNAIVGNEIADDQQTGIRIEGSGLFGFSGNVIGGDTAGAENTIDGSAGAAIEIQNPKMSQNEVARNRGFDNGGLFIDLLASTPDPGDTDPGEPNDGILPPTLIAGETSATGLANPGATVRVFGKQTSNQGEIESFLGETTADEGGNWTLTFPALPAGAFVAATQTNELGGTSELAIAGVGSAPKEGGSPGPTPVDSRGDRRPPHTEILQRSRELSRSRSVRFFFASNERGSRFQCSLDGGGFRGCKSPKRYRGLAPGKHVFRVRAIDRAGNVDPTPAKRRFRVLG